MIKDWLEMAHDGTIQEGFLLWSRVDLRLLSLLILILIRPILWMRKIQPRDLTAIYSNRASKGQNQRLFLITGNAAPLFENGETEAQRLMWLSQSHRKV